MACTVPLVSTYNFCKYIGACALLKVCTFSILYFCVSVRAQVEKLFSVLFIRVPVRAQVDKIFGPGNQYVTAAKMALQNSEAMIAIDMPAGPSEVLVIADGGAPASHVAADLLSQAEHGPDSQARMQPKCRVPSHE